MLKIILRFSECIDATFLHKNLKFFVKSSKFGILFPIPVPFALKLVLVT